MKLTETFSGIAVAASLFVAGTAFDGMLGTGIIIGEAEARIGRPLTPGSVAGVSRRTTRRVIRRTAVAVAALPVGCTTVVIEGTTLHQCGATYYQSSGTQYIVVEIN